MNKLFCGLLVSASFLLAPCVFAQNAEQSSDPEVLVSPPNNAASSDQKMPSNAGALERGNALTPSPTDQVNPANDVGKKGGHKHRKHNTDDSLSNENPSSSGQ